MKNDTVLAQIFLSIIVLLLFCGATNATAQPAAPSKSDFRPRAIPLITCDPYFSIWSVSDTLTDEWTRH